MTEIALFPIPNCVSFPGTVFPLHVFEPRYRQMVKDCLEQDRLLAICHTEKEIKAAKEQQTLEQALSSNQATYKPYPVFSAGKCELKKTLDDGRLYLHVHMEQRFQVIRELQTLPYVLAECEAFDDDKIAAQEEVALLQEKILARLGNLTHHVPELSEMLRSDRWVKKDPHRFSFEIFGLLDFDAEEAQQVLEMQSPVARLDFLLKALNNQ